MANWDWSGKMSADEEKNMKGFIQYLYDGFIKYGNDRFVEHIFYEAVREVTRFIGQYRNLKMSTKAIEILGKCTDMKAVEKAKRNAPEQTVNEHQIPAKKFWKEFEARKGIDAERWLNEAVIAIITKEEDGKITDKGWKDERPCDAYEQLGIKTEDV